MTPLVPHVLITGAASGIGRATAMKAIERGWQLTAVDRDAAQLDATIAGRHVCQVVADLADPDGFDGIIQLAEEFHHTIPTVLIHCAGLYHIKPVLELTVTDWRRTIDINATATLFLAAAFAKALIERQLSGSVVTLSSIAARHGDAHEPAAAYSSSKAAVEAITRQLAIELGPHGIRVNSVAPGLIDTPMLRITDDPDAAAAYIADALPLRRLGSPDEVADVCLYLAGPHATYVSGATVVVDGGLTA
jgi:NAD(P)-dependent dehydrogenase (short-subunit alcohol dehydrogenase family)